MSFGTGASNVNTPSRFAWPVISADFSNRIFSADRVTFTRAPAAGLPKK